MTNKRSDTRRTAKAKAKAATRKQSRVLKATAPSAAWEAMLASPAPRRAVEQIGGAPMESGPGMWHGVPPPIADSMRSGKAVAPHTVKDQSTGCDCRPIMQDGKTIHEHWCSWWDLHPEASPPF